jgi:protein TonB
MARVFSRHKEAVMFELITGEAQHAPRPHAIPLLATTIAHVAIVGAVIAVPLLFLTEQLPEIPDMMAFVAAPPAPSPPPPPPPPLAPAARKAEAKPVTPSALPDPAAAPSVLPEQIQPEAPVDEGADEAAGEGVEGGVEGGIPGGVVGGVVGGLPTPVPPPPPLPTPPAPRAPVRTGGHIETPALIQRVEPEYPAFAVSAHIEGLVILEAVVDQEGRVAEVRVLRSAGGILDKAAMTALKQWRYSPLLLNGMKERFVLTVTLSFQLEDRKAAS